jgi:hypothetical protein
LVLAEQQKTFNQTSNPYRFDLYEHLTQQAEWSAKTFGPGGSTLGIIDHIKKEIKEIEQTPFDLEEWVDVLILAFDACWRAGYSPDETIAMLVYKDQKNKSRKWPDWRTAEPGKAIEHIKEDTTEDQNYWFNERN